MRLHPTSNTRQITSRMRIQTRTLLIQVGRGHQSGRIKADAFKANAIKSDAINKADASKPRWKLINPSRTRIQTRTQKRLFSASKADQGNRRKQYKTDANIKADAETIFSWISNDRGDNQPYLHYQSFGLGSDNYINLRAEYL